MDMQTVLKMLEGYPQLQDMITVTYRKDLIYLDFMKRHAERDMENDHDPENSYGYNVTSYTEEELKNLIEEYRAYLNFGFHRPDTKQGYY